MSAIPKIKPWRSEKHRRLVASLPCAQCGIEGSSQCAHANFGKGFGTKVSDILTFPLCQTCHAHHDQGGMDRDKRHLREWELCDAKRSMLMRKHLWSAEDEMHYQDDIRPLARMVHGD